MKDSETATHHRRSIRLPGHDYAAGGTYFVTINTDERRKRFGTLVNGRMALNEAGRMAAACWGAIPEHFPHASLDEWVIMPDHVHGIITIRPGGRTDDGTASRPLATPSASVPTGASITGDASRVRAKDFSPLPCGTGTSRTLGSIVRGFKIGVTKSLASRTGNGTAPSSVNDWPVAPVCVISGFLSPLERGVFDQCLARGIPMIQILARGLPTSFSPRVQRAIVDGRLLVLSPFPPEQASFSTVRAAWSNQYVLHLAHHIIIGQLSPDGMLACLLADLPNNKPITFLSNRENDHV